MPRLARVAAGLLKIAADFGLLTGTVAKEFAGYHLPERSLIYLLHAVLEHEHGSPWSDARVAGMADVFDATCGCRDCGCFASTSSALSTIRSPGVSYRSPCRVRVAGAYAERMVA